LPPLFATAVCPRCLPPLFATAVCHRCLPPLFATAVCHRCFCVRCFIFGHHGGGRPGSRARRADRLRAARATGRAALSETVRMPPNLGTEPARFSRGGATHAAPSKHHDENISFAFFHTKYGERIVIMVFRRAILKVLCLSPPGLAPSALFVTARRSPVSHG
jgi:hypothetical protein